MSQTLPGSDTGTDQLTVKGTWSDAFTATSSGAVTLPGGCTPPPPVQNLAGHIYQCTTGGAQTTTEVPGGTLAATGPQTVAAVPNPLAPLGVDAGTYTMTASAPAGYQLVVCGGNSTPSGGGTTATESVPVPSGGSGTGIFYVVPIVQNLAGHIYQCTTGGAQTTTEVPGGTLAATGPQTVAAVPNPLAPLGVDAGTYTMTASAPAGWTLVVCGGSAQPSTSGSTATEPVDVPSGGAGTGIFYVIKMTTSPTTVPPTTTPTPAPGTVASTTPASPTASPTAAAGTTTSTQPLAFTGFDFGEIAGGATLLVLLGGFLLGTTRRRRREAETG
jgi:hypothetical protein